MVVATRRAHPAHPRWLVVARTTAQSGDTALHNAVCSSSPHSEDVARMLIDHGVDVDKQKEVRGACLRVRGGRA